MSRIAAVNTYGLDDNVPYGVAFSFGYTGPGTGELPYLLSMGSVGVDFRTGNADLLDVNRDGLPDVIDSSLPTQRFFVNTPLADYDATLSVPYDSAVAVAGGANLASPRVQPVDVDGDGFTDLVDGNNARTLPNTGSGDWARAVSSDFALPDFENNPNLRFFDYDPCRRSDAVLVTDTDTFYYRNVPGAYSGDLDHPFRRKPIGCSGRSRSPVPGLPITGGHSEIEHRALQPLVAEHSGGEFSGAGGDIGKLGQNALVERGQRNVLSGGELDEQSVVCRMISPQRAFIGSRPKLFRIDRPNAKEKCRLQRR